LGAASSWAPDDIHVTTPLSLDAYFDRIGWGGSGAPTYETLAGILGAHMAAIPFENFDVLLGRPPRLDIESLQAKLLRARRGGYCFEHATLFAAVLEAMGFAPVRHSARVVLIVPAAEAPRTHMFLTVPLPGGTFVADPGFGRFAPRVPVPLRDGVKASFDGETHWMERTASGWALRVATKESSVAAWVTTLEHDNAADFSMANHYTATHPASAFLNRIMLRALTPDGRVSVMNREVTIARGARTDTALLPDRAALRRLVAAHFGFDLPEIESLRVPSIDEWR